MATSKETVAYVLEQLEPLNVRARAMFGEYGVYCDDKIVALICDDTVFIKPTRVTDGMPEAPPYPGAKNSRVADAAVIADSERFRTIVQASADALPAPKPKPKKTR